MLRFFNLLSMMLSRLSGFIGFLRSASAPSMLSCGKVLPVSIIFKVLGDNFWISGKSSVPSMSGRRKSINATSKQLMLNFSMASLPLSATVTQYPFFWKIRLKTCRIAGSSSMISIDGLQAINKKQNPLLD